MFPPKALQHGFFDFETFDVEEYEHYEVRILIRTVYTCERSQICFEESTDCHVNLCVML